MNRHSTLLTNFVFLFASIIGANGLHAQTTSTADLAAKNQSASPYVMTTDAPQVAEIKAAIERLMNSAKNGEIEFLEEIYHEHMRIYMINGDNEVMEMNKPMFIAHIKKAVEAGEGVNTWAKFHKIEANENAGHVLISRKVNLTGTEKMITLSIDLVRAEKRWQIIRETIFTGTDQAAKSKPASENAKPASENEKQTRDDLESFNQRFNQIVSKYDADSFVKLYKTDSWLIAPEAKPSADPDELRKMIGFLSKKGYSMAHTIDRVLISEDLSQAILIGEAEATNDAHPARAVGTYLFVMQKVDSEWKIAIDMFNQYESKK